MNKFPGCLKADNRGVEIPDLRLQGIRQAPLLKTRLEVGTSRESDQRETSPVISSPYRKECQYELGGVTFYLEDVWLSRSPTRFTPTRTDQVFFVVPNEAERRAFTASFEKKYGAGGDEVCSRYTCLIASFPFMAQPTPYVTSILDAVKVDSSQF